MCTKPCKGGLGLGSFVWHKDASPSLVGSSKVMIGNYMYVFSGATTEGSVFRAWVEIN